MYRTRVFLSLGALFLLLCLSGCPAIPYVAEDQRSMSTEYDDAGIETSIKTSLMADDLGKSLNLNVYSFRGHVYLIGEADAKSADFAERAARSVEGVRKVTTRWYPVGTSDRVADTSLETAIDAKLLFASDVGSTRVDVDVWGGNVTLLGIMTTQAEIERAEKAAREADGIRSLTSYLMTNDQSLKEAMRK